VGLAVAMADALVHRGVPEATARLAAELGVLAFKDGYAAWVDADQDSAAGFAPYALAALDDLRVASATLG
jgi:hypothetical protein